MWGVGYFLLTIANQHNAINVTDQGDIWQVMRIIVVPSRLQ